jgi:hypothetical protein
MLKYASIFCFVVLWIVPLSSQTPQTSHVSSSNADTLGVFGPKVWYFPIARSELRRDYRDNARMCDALDSLLSIPHVLHRIDSVFIVAAASPIGSDLQNRSLSEARAYSLMRYIREHHPAILSSAISVRAIGVDHDGYRALYEEQQKEVDAMTPAQRNRWLFQKVYPRLQYVSVRILLNDGTLIHPEQGSPIRILMQQSPEVRYDTIRVTVYDTVRIVQTVQPPPVIPLPPTPVDTIIISNKSQEKPSPPPSRLAIKTNLLYDLALLPNLTVEYSLTPRWSVALEGYWSWWSMDAPKYWYHRIQMVGVEGKYWIGNLPLRRRMNGHHIGMYALAGNYDLRLFTTDPDDLGYQSPWSYSAGFSYGYTHAIGRRWAFDYSLGVGYLGGIYHEYNRSRCLDCAAKRTTKKMSYYGPTRAVISLIYQMVAP